MKETNDTLERYKATVRWFEDVYSIKIEIKKSKANKEKPFWANVKHNEEIESTDYFSSYGEAIVSGIHIAFNVIK